MTDKSTDETTNAKRSRKQSFKNFINFSTALEEQPVVECVTKNETQKIENTSDFSPFPIRRMSILTGYKYPRNTKPNHFCCYEDVKIKPQSKKRSIVDVANSEDIDREINDWKIRQFTDQISSLVDDEKEFKDSMKSALDTLKSQTKENNEELKKCMTVLDGNVQRSMLISDQLSFNSAQIRKLLDHKPRVEKMLSIFKSKNE